MVRRDYRGRWRGRIWRRLAVLLLGCTILALVAAPGDAAPAAQAPGEPVPLLTRRYIDDVWQYSLTVALPDGWDRGPLRLELIDRNPFAIMGHENRPLPRPELVADNGDGRFRPTVTRWTAVAPTRSFVGPAAISGWCNPDYALGPIPCIDLIQPQVDARVSWAGPPAGEVWTRTVDRGVFHLAKYELDRVPSWIWISFGMPPLGDVVAPLALPPDGSTTLIPLRNITGFAAVPPGVGRTPVTWTVRTTDQESDPPADFDPAIWWITGAELTGTEPLHVPLVLLLPVRAPLTPGVPVRLFHQTTEGNWDAAGERGVTTPDGLYAAVAVDAPGLYVAGVQERFRQVDPNRNPRLVIERVPRQVTIPCQNIGGCSFGGAVPYSAACTPDTSICVSMGAGPPAFINVCAYLGGVRHCARHEGEPAQPG